ncbi:MAG: VWA domain-containing protein [Nanoarchaeota archaeon]
MLPLDQYMLNTAGVFAFLSLIPFILIYLIRPKPKDKVMSSLLFILKSEGRISQHSFLRYLLRNLLFLMQLFTILFLAGAITKPYILRDEGVSSENTAIVIDNSASMQAAFNGDTRLEKAKDMAKKMLGERNTVISAAESPELLVKTKGRGEASAAIDKIKPYDTGTGLADAVRFAGEQIEGEGKVFVLSDFIIRDENELFVAKSLLASKGIAVEFIDLSGPAENIGIVDLKLADTSVVSVKNFNDKAQKITLKVGKTAQELDIMPHDVKTFSFPTPDGQTIIELDAKDDFPADNKAYLSAPEKTENSILIIGNVRDKYLEAALRANPKNKVSVAEPPLVPDVSQDVVILDQVDKTLLLKETIREIDDLVSDGRTFVIITQPGLADLDLRGMLPVTLGEASADTVAPIIMPTSYTKDIEASSVKGYVKAVPKENAVSIFSVGQESLLAYAKHGAGNVLYYGIDDDNSDFKTTPSYPLFWNSMVKAMVGRDSIAELNFRTGTVLGDKRLMTAGFHKIGNKDVAANLLLETESAVSKQEKLRGSIADGSTVASTVQKPWPFDHYLLWAALALILLEFFYIKYRGDF